MTMLESPSAKSSGRGMITVIVISLFSFTSLYGSQQWIRSEYMGEPSEDCVVIKSSNSTLATAPNANTTSISSNSTWTSSTTALSLQEPLTITSLDAASTANAKFSSNSTALSLQMIPSPAWVTLAEQRSSVDYFACAGIGHRLVRMADAYSVAKTEGFALRANWGFCQVDRSIAISHFVQIFDHLFEPESVAQVLEVDEIMNEEPPESVLNVSMGKLIQISNEVPGFKQFVRRGKNSKCECTPEREKLNYEFYQDLRKRFRQRDYVDQFYRDNFDDDELVIALHVRAGNGEKGGFASKNRAIKDYDVFASNATDTLIRMYEDITNSTFHNSVNGTTFSVFFATDTPSMVDKFRTNLAAHGIKVVTYEEQQRVPEGTGTFVEGARGGGTCLKNWDDVTLDLMLVSNADVVVSGQASSFTQSMPLSVKLESPMSSRKVRKNYCEFHPSGREYQCYDTSMSWCCEGTTRFHKAGIPGSEFRRIIDASRTERAYDIRDRAGNNTPYITAPRCLVPRCRLPQFWPSRHTDFNNSEFHGMAVDRRGW